MNYDISYSIYEKSPCRLPPLSPCRIARTRCCGNGLPVQWSIADLTGTDTPVWGSQMGIDGKGKFTADGVYELQTFTFVPEPSAAMLVFLFCGFLLTRRSRLH